MRRAFGLQHPSHSHSQESSYRALTLAVVTAAAFVFAGGNAAAWTLDTRHTFCKQAGCADGSMPQAALLMADKRHFFGAASSGGAHASTNHGGVVFELIHNTDGSWSYKVIHSFCAQSGCADGDDPLADLIVDKDGNLYGTTWAGGAHAQGCVFKLTHGNSGWTETVIYSFSGGIGSSTDGRDPAAGLTYAGQSTGVPWDEFSPLFGTTYTGGTHGNGTVFKLVSDGSLWNIEIIHSFNTSKFPEGIAADGAGNLYGATLDGGAHAGGLFYKLAHDTWNETILHQFCSQANCRDGASMSSRPVIDASGNIYGATVNGGVLGGTVFELVKGSGSYTFKVIHQLCPSGSCPDGETGRGIVMDSNGDLLGAASDGGANHSGTIFRLHKGTKGWKDTAIYSFCSQPHCGDGAAPQAPPILDSHGNLFGTTYAGGDATRKAGTVYELTP